uniref:Uncharacterized protein n=1 Tax=Tetranychus urticae TaxID=32264 RepID=T1L4G6_TETUR
MCLCHIYRKEKVTNQLIFFVCPWKTIQKPGSLETLLLDKYDKEFDITIRQISNHCKHLGNIFHPEIPENA